MRGVILAGGMGTRLLPATLITNKHLLPVYKKLMIEYPLQTLLDLGIKDIIIVSGGNNIGDFASILGSGKKYNARFTYVVQDEPLGIAHAVSLTTDFLNNEPFVVILGDNYFEDNISNLVDLVDVKDFNSGSMIFLKEVPDPQRFGCPGFINGKISVIDEKPKNPKSNYAVTGLYFYDNTFKDKFKILKPSGRGEYELTDINNLYLKEGKLNHKILKGLWSDMGLHDTLLRVANFAKEKDNNSSNP